MATAGQLAADPQRTPSYYLTLPGINAADSDAWSVERIQQRDNVLGQSPTLTPRVDLQPPDVLVIATTVAEVTGIQGWRSRAPGPRNSSRPRIRPCVTNRSQQAFNVRRRWQVKTAIFVIFAASWTISPTPGTGTC